MTKRIENEDWSGVRFKNINFAGAKVVEGNFHEANFNGFVGSMRVNGIHVWPLIAAELERRHPERKKLSPSDPRGFLEALEIVETQVEDTWKRADGFTGQQLNEQVDEEWSAVETTRHMVMVIDSWLGKTVLGDPDPYHPIGLPPSFMPRKPEGTSIDPDANPTFDEAREVLRGRLATLHHYVEELTSEELDRELGLAHAENVRDALHVILDELWSHNQFMNRDLTVIEGRS